MDSNYYVHGNNKYFIEIFQYIYICDGHNAGFSSAELDGGHRRDQCLC